MSLKERVLTGLMGAGRPQDVPMIAKWCAAPYKELSKLLADLCNQELITMIHRKAMITEKGEEEVLKSWGRESPVAKVVYRNRFVEKIVEKVVQKPPIIIQGAPTVQGETEKQRAGRIYNRSIAQLYMKNKTR